MQRCCFGRMSIRAAQVAAQLKYTNCAIDSDQAPWCKLEVEISQNVPVAHNQTKLLRSLKRICGDDCVLYGNQC